MTNIERLVPHILNLVDVSRWETKARLLSLVAARTFEWEGTWAQLGAPDLAAFLDEPPERAACHLRTMREMATEDRVLDYRAGHGRRLPLWRVAGDGPEAVLRWRHVPWWAPRTEILAYLQVALDGVGVANNELIAAQSMSNNGAESPGDALVTGATRDFGPPGHRSPPRQHRSPPRPPHGPPGQDFVNGSTSPLPATPDAYESGPAGDPHLAFKDPYIDPLLLKGGCGGARGEEEEEGEAQRPKEPGRRLPGVVVEALAQRGHLVYGAAAAALAALVSTELEAVVMAELVASLPLANVRYAPVAAQLVAEAWERKGRQEAERRAREAFVESVLAEPVPCEECHWDQEGCIGHKGEACWRFRRSH